MISVLWFTHVNHQSHFVVEVKAVFKVLAVDESTFTLVIRRLIVQNLSVAHVKTCVAFSCYHNFEVFSEADRRVFKGEQRLETMTAKTSISYFNTMQCNVPERLKFSAKTLISKIIQSDVNFDF